MSLQTSYRFLNKNQSGGSALSSMQPPTTGVNPLGLSKTFDMNSLLTGAGGRPPMPAASATMEGPNKTIKEVTGENFFTRYDGFYNSQVNGESPGKKGSAEAVI